MTTSGRCWSNVSWPPAGTIELAKAGVPGYDTRLEVLYLKQIFAQTAPDAVVLGFLTNDVFTNEPLESTGKSCLRNWRSSVRMRRT